MVEVEKSMIFEEDEWEEGEDEEWEEEEWYTSCLETEH